MYVLAAVALGLAVPGIPIGFTVSSGRVIEALVAVGIGIVTFIGVVDSLLFLVVQFGTTTFTPRLNLFRDAPIVWHVFGFFAGIMVFSFTATFSIGGQDEEIPASSRSCWAYCCWRRWRSSAGCRRPRFIRSSLHRRSGRSPTAGARSSIVSTWGRTGFRVPGGSLRTPTCPAETLSGRTGAAVLQVIDVPPLIRRARQEGVAIEFRSRPGDTVAEDDVLAVIHGGHEPGLEIAVLAATRAGRERTFEQDPLFAVRVLADIALRGLSPAVRRSEHRRPGLDAIDSLLRPLAARDLDIGRIWDEHGALRVVVPMPAWEDFIAVALDELIPLSGSSIHVRHRIRRMIEELAGHAPPERHAALQARLARLDPARPILGEQSVCPGRSAER